MALCIFSSKSTTGQQKTTIANARLEAILDKEGTQSSWVEAKSSVQPS